MATITENLQTIKDSTMDIKNAIEDMGGTIEGDMTTYATAIRSIPSGSGNGAYALVEHGTNDTTFMLTPNTFHVWGEVTSLTLTFGEEQSGVANEYLFQFESGSEATTLALPDGIVWSNGDAPVIESGYIYQISILKGLATLMNFAKPISLISFAVGSETFQAEKGMTWSNFVYSGYNPNVEGLVSAKQKFTIDSGIVKCFSNDWMSYFALYYNNNDVLENELIIDNGIYQINEPNIPTPPIIP